MSLLIESMDMPKLNENEEHLWMPGWLEISKDGKAVFCTGTHFDPNTIRSYAIEEVSTHGRLIDAEELIEQLRRYHSTITFGTRTFSLTAIVRDVEKIINELPTIIEAEE